MLMIRLAHPEGAGEIDVEHHRPGVGVGVGQTGPVQHPGGVDHDVEPAAPRDHVRDGLVHGPLVAEVRGERQPFGTTLRRGFGTAPVAVQHRDVEPVLVQRHARRGTDAGRSAGDQCDPSFHHGHTSQAASTPG